MGFGTPSGTVGFNPFASDLVLDALERAGIEAPELKHMFSARRSGGLILASKWSNRGPNLWKIDREPTVIPLIAGVVAYDLTPDIIAMYDTYRRQYSMNAAASAPVNFSTVNTSKSVTVRLVNHGLLVGSYVSIAVQVSVGGIVLYGFYQVQAVPDANDFVVTAATAATATVNNGGAVPVFTATAGSNVISVALANHGLVGRQSFVVPVLTIVGGIPLQGSYVVQSVTDANDFTITAAQNALSNGVVAENGGQTQFASQVQGPGAYSDILMSPLSRNDYAAQANKQAPGPPTTYWYEKLITPRIEIYPVTDTSGPYELRSYFQRQIQDFNPSGGQTMDMPQRGLMAFTVELAADLASKFNKSRYADLRTMADSLWEDFEASDVENVTTSIIPDFAGYG